MIQENFVNTYIEILSATVTEAIQKNLVLQAQKKITEQSLEEAKKSLEKENTSFTKLKQDFDDVIRQRDKNAHEATEHKKNSEHIETFKNELVRCRKHNEELNVQVQSLKTEIISKEKKNEELLAEIISLKAEIELKSKKIEDLKEEYSSTTKSKSKTKTAEKVIQDSGKF